MTCVANGTMTDSTISSSTGKGASSMCRIPLATMRSIWAALWAVVPDSPRWSTKASGFAAYSRG